jgi:hypothetical protein
MAYNPEKLDIDSIENTLYCIINLNVYNKEKNRLKCSEKVKELMDYFKNS